MKYWFKRKYWQIKNLLKWIPIIWKQYDFDYTYSINVFKHQLKKQADFLESNRAYTQSAKYNATRIRTVLKLMDKVYNDEYALEYQEKLKQIYGDDILDFNFKKLDDSNSSLLEYKFESFDNADEISILKDKLFKDSIKKQEKAHKLLWKMIERYIRNWWD